MPDRSTTRRDVMKTLTLGGAAALLGGGGLTGARAASAHTASTRPAAPAPATPAGAGKRRVLRVAHVTDVHVQPERGAGEGLAACLRHIQSQPDRPDLIVNTGDCIMDAFKRDDARTREQWDLWTRVWRDECSLPVEHCLGNHDVWGWNRKRSRTTGSEPGWGKRRACDVLGLDRPYRSFDRDGWHVVVLDSVIPLGEDSYTAGLDDEQFDWLRRDLSDAAARAPRTPVLVLSHIPVVSVAAMMGDKNADRPAPGTGIQLPHGAMHGDYRRIVDAFGAHGNVRLALSGHLHRLDRCNFGGTSYLCNGAVSGGWWKGPNYGDLHAGYALVNLYADGTFDHEYVLYGWQYHDEPEPTARASGSGGFTFGPKKQAASAVAGLGLVAATTLVARRWRGSGQTDGALAGA